MLVQTLPIPGLLDQSVNVSLNILIEFKLTAEPSVSRISAAEISIREWLPALILAQYSGYYLKKWTLKNIIKRHWMVNMPEKNSFPQAIA